MYQGWMSLGGSELWNVARTASYVRANLPSIQLFGCEDCETLHLALGDEEYKNNPVDDDAPWIAADEPDLSLFYGFFPISVSGLTDNSASVVVTESSSDGGRASAIRRTSLEFRVSGLLMAGSAIALSKGKSWLRRTVEGPPCGPGCNGADLCFFGACPADFEQGDYYLRTVRDVSLIAGPTTTREFSPQSLGGGCEPGEPVEGASPATGAYMEQVEFSFVATTPFIYLPLDHLGSTVGSEGTSTLTIDTTIPMLPECSILPDPPITDPAAPVLPQPPRPPSVTTTLRPAEQYASGYSIFIPKDRVPETLDAVLIVSLTTGVDPVRYVRLRLYAAPLGFAQKVTDLEPCSYCGEVIVTYIPPRSRFTIDGMNQSLTITDTSGHVHQATNLAFSGAGLPTAWPAVACGMDYWLSVEFPGGQPGGSSAPTNLFVTGAVLPSASFDTNLGSWTNGVDDGSPRAVLTWDNTVAHSVLASMKVHWPLGSTDRPQVLLRNLVVGRVYELSGWVLSPSARVRLDLGPTANGAQSTPSGSWQHLSVNITATADTMMARLSNSNTLDSGDVWVDDFSLLDASAGIFQVMQLDLSTARRE